MSANTSSAVMQQRKESHDSLDYFPTPPWATRALCAHILKDAVSGRSCWEPACGEGHMTRPLSEYFARVVGTDVHPYGHGEVEDFLFPNTSRRADWVITNPPFRLAEEFIHMARSRARDGVAMLVRSAFLESVGRHERLFSRTPPSLIAQFSERVPMVKGRCLQDATTATAYCWLVWVRDVPGTAFGWIPPCRKQLERAGDYGP